MSNGLTVGTVVDGDYNNILRDGKGTAIIVLQTACAEL